MFFCSSPTVHTGMRFRSFREFVQFKEGLLLPDRPPARGLPRLNATPFTNDQRRKRTPKVIRPSKRLPSTIRKVADIVTLKPIPRLTFT